MIAVLKTALMTTTCMTECGAEEVAQSVVRWRQLSTQPLVLLLLACVTPLSYYCGGLSCDVDNGGGSGRQKLSSKWRGAPALMANANSDGMNEGGEGLKIKYRNIKYLSTFYAVVASNSCEYPSSLQCRSSTPAGCSAASCPAPPQLLSWSLTTSHCALLDLWCGRLSSTLAVCQVTLSSRRCLPSTGASTSRCAFASSCSYCPLLCLLSAMVGCHVGNAVRN